MKRFLVILTVAMMAVSFALADTTDNYQPVTSLEQLCGVWAFCGGSENLPYLVLRSDGTYTGFDFWQIDEDSTTGDALLKHGSYTFNSTDSTLSLEGIDTIYTAKTCIAWEDLSYPDSTIEVMPETPVLMLEAPAAGEDDPTALYLQMTDNLPLLPLLSELCEGEWIVSETPEVDSMSSETFTFTMDGQVLMETTTADGTVEANGTYQYSQGLLTVISDYSYSLLLQCHYVPCINGAPPEGYDYQQAEERGFSTALNHSILVVHDLGDGSVFYLIRSNG